MSSSLECTVCKEADLSEVISGVLECGHVYCHDCIYKLWHSETEAATQRTEARAHMARTQPQTRAQMQARAAADAADNGRNVRCPCCQQCSSVDSVRRVYLSSSQAPSVASPGSHQALTRASSTSSAYEEKLEDLNAQLACAIEHLDAAHARAAETARAHDLNVQQMQAQLMAHAEQAHQTQLQELLSANMRLQSDLENAQAQLHHEESQLRAQHNRAVEELTQAREKSRAKKARASDPARGAGMDKFEEQLRASGQLGKPFKSDKRVEEPARQAISSAAVAAVAPAPASTHVGGRQVKKEGGPIFTRHVLDHASPSVKSEASSTSHATTARLRPETTGVSSGTRSRRAEVAPTSLNDLRNAVKVEKKPKIADIGPSNVLQEVAPKRQTRATTSANITPKVTTSRQTSRAVPVIEIESSEDEDDYHSPAEQQNRRQEALARGLPWPLAEHIIVPVCTSKFDHNFNGKGSNGNYLKYRCKACDWQCEERTPEGYIPLSKRGKAK